MDASSVSPLRRAVVALALLVPLVVDPHGPDTLVFKQLALGAAGLAWLLLDALGTCVAGRPWMRSTPVERALLLLAAWGGVSLAWAENVAIGVPWLAALLGMVGISRGVRSVADGAADLSRWIAALVVVGLCVFVVDGSAVVQGLPDLEDSRRKFASWLFKHNNIAANYAALLVPLALASALAARTRGTRVAGWVAAALLVAYLLLLRSRAGLGAALTGGLVVGCVLTWRRLRGALPAPGRRAQIVAVVLVALASLMPLSDTARGVLKARFYDGVRVLESLGLGDLGDATFRITLFRKAVEMSAEQSLLGVGVGNFPVVYPRFEPLMQVKPHAHNDMFHVLAELGWPGVVLLLAVFATLVLSLLRAAGRARDARVLVLLAGLLGLLTTFLLCGLFEVPFRIGSTASILAVAAGLAARMEAGDRDAPPLLAGGRGRIAAGVHLVLAASGLLFILWRLPASVLLGDGLARLEAAQRHAAAGDAAAALADRRAARDVLGRLARLPTGSPLPHTLLGRMSLEEGDAEGALSSFRAARARSPYDVESLQDEGEAYLDLGRHDEALLRFHEAVSRSPARKDAIVRLVRALAESGRRPAAIDLLEHQAQSRPAEVDLDVIMMLANQWREQAAEWQGPERVRALVAARHFYAVVLEDGEARLGELASAHFQHCTHQLQSLPGAPDSWWTDVYLPWLDAGGWRMPNAALWTAMDSTGRKLYPGWEEAAGPPLPRHLR